MGCYKREVFDFIRNVCLSRKVVACMLTCLPIAFGCSSTTKIQMTSANETLPMRAVQPNRDQFNRNNLPEAAADFFLRHPTELSVLRKPAVLPKNESAPEKNPATDTPTSPRFNRMHAEELIEWLMASVPEPMLVEDPFVENSCAESARSWCNPDIKEDHFTSFDFEKQPEFHTAIFPQFVSPVKDGLLLRGMAASTKAGKKRKRGHYGIDVIPSDKARSGVPILAVEDGTVVRISTGRGYGYYTVIYHQNGIFSLYSHITKNVPVKVGEKVNRGETIAYMGKSGNARGYHLHFELIDLRESWDLDQSIDEFVTQMYQGKDVKTWECNKFSKLIFSKQVKEDPLESISGLTFAKRSHGKWAALPKSSKKTTSHTAKKR